MAIVEPARYAASTILGYPSANATDGGQFNREEFIRDLSKNSSPINHIVRKTLEDTTSYLNVSVNNSGLFLTDPSEEANSYCIVDGYIFSIVNSGLAPTANTGLISSSDLSALFTSGVTEVYAGLAVFMTVAASVEHLAEDTTESGVAYCNALKLVATNNLSDVNPNKFLLLATVKQASGGGYTVTQNGDKYQSYTTIDDVLRLIGNTVDDKIALKIGKDKVGDIDHVYNPTASELNLLSALYENCQTALYIGYRQDDGQKTTNYAFLDLTSMNVTDDGQGGLKLIDTAKDLYESFVTHSQRGQDITVHVFKTTSESGFIYQNTGLSGIDHTGDVNNDGDVTMKDLLVLRKYLLGMPSGAVNENASLTYLNSLSTLDTIGIAIRQAGLTLNPEMITYRLSSQPMVLYRPYSGSVEPTFEGLKYSSAENIDREYCFTCIRRGRSPAEAYYHQMKCTYNPTAAAESQYSLDFMIRTITLSAVSGS